ncbi:MAG: 50S ribosomal protein L23 [Vulcanimicrobiaceae bacterium]
MDARDVIVAPMITEKSMGQTTADQYTFEVHRLATKPEIRAAVEELFKVTVLKVNTVRVGGKTKNFARRGVRTSGRLPDWKKAVVTIKAGQKIELGGVNYFEQ